MNTRWRLLMMSAVVASAVLASPPAHAQVGIICALGPTGGFMPALSSQPTPLALQVGVRIYTLLCPKGCGNIFLYQNPTTPNALTMTGGMGVSNIIYSPTFMNAIEVTYGSGATFGILAHEIGHHIDLNSSFQAQMSTSWSKELRADAWAGCALAKANLSTAALRSSMLAISAYPSPTHPSWQMRWPAVEFGYTSCGGSGLANPTAPASTGPTAIPTSTGTKSSTDPCGCTKANAKCINKIIDLDACIEAKRSACMSECEDDPDETDDCESEVCSDDSDKYVGWQSSCKATIKASTTKCAETLKTCQSSCTK